jgi:DNA adenine methylase
MNDLLRLIPKHDIYVEVFGGGAQLLFAKKPAKKLDVYNDLDKGLVGFFAILRNEKKAKKLQALLELTPYSRQEYYDCKTWAECEDDIDRARRWFVRMRMCFSGQFGAGWSHTTFSRKRIAANWFKSINGLDACIVRMQNTQVENKDFRELIPMYDSAKTLFYCDPPYVSSTLGGASSGGYYNINMSDNDHEELIDLLLNIKGMCILSGYDNPIYERLEKKHNWKKLQIKITKRMALKKKGSRREKAIECLWMNYGKGIKTIKSGIGKFF